MYVQLAIDLLQEKREVIVNGGKAKYATYYERELNGLRELQAKNENATVDEIIPVLYNNRPDNKIQTSDFCRNWITPIVTALHAKEQQNALDAEKQRPEEIEKKKPQEVEAQRLADEEELRLKKQEERELLHILLEREEDRILNPQTIEDYEIALDELMPKIDVKVEPHLRKLLADLDKLSDADDEVRFLILQKTRALLTDQLTDKEYQDFGKSIQGKPSPALRAIGIIMLSLAAAVLVAGSAATAVLGLGTVGVGVTLVGAAGFATAGGASFFAGRQKGLSKDVEDVYESHHAVSLGA